MSATNYECLDCCHLQWTMWTLEWKHISLEGWGKVIIYHAIAFGKKWSDRFVYRFTRKGNWRNETWSPRKRSWNDERCSTMQQKSFVSVLETVSPRSPGELISFCCLSKIKASFHSLFGIVPFLCLHLTFLHTYFCSQISSPGAPVILVFNLPPNRLIF